MIIKKQEEPNLVMSNKPEGLWNAGLEGDKFKFLHSQNVTTILQAAYQLREQDNNGFTKDRSLRQIACIPALEFAKHPEFVKDPQSIKKWLKTPAGSIYRTVKKGL